MANRPLLSDKGALLTLTDEVRATVSETLDSGGEWWSHISGLTNEEQIVSYPVTLIAASLYRIVLVPVQLLSWAQQELSYDNFDVISYTDYYIDPDKYPDDVIYLATLSDEREDDVAISLAMLRERRANVVMMSASGAYPSFLSQVKLIIARSYRVPKLIKSAPDIRKAVLTAYNYLVEQWSAKLDSNEIMILVLPDTNVADGILRLAKDNPRLRNKIEYHRSINLNSNAEELEKATVRDYTRTNQSRIILVDSQLEIMIVRGASLIVDTGLQRVVVTDKQGYSTSHYYPIDRRSAARRTLMTDNYVSCYFDQRDDFANYFLPSSTILSPDSADVYILGEAYQEVYAMTHPELIEFYQQPSNSIPLKYDIRPRLVMEKISQSKEGELGAKDIPYLIAALQLRPEGELLEAIKRVNNRVNNSEVGREASIINYQVQLKARFNLVDVLTGVYPRVEDRIWLNESGSFYHQLSQ